MTPCPTLIAPRKPPGPTLPFQTYAVRGGKGETKNNTSISTTPILLDTSISTTPTLLDTSISTTLTLLYIFNPLSIAPTSISNLRPRLAPHRSFKDTLTSGHTGDTVEGMASKRKTSTAAGGGVKMGNIYE